MGCLVIYNKFWVLPNQQPVGNKNNMHHESISLTIKEHSKLVWSEQLFTMHRICVLVALCLYAAYGYESCDQKIMEDTICSLLVSVKEVSNMKQVLVVNFNLQYYVGVFSGNSYYFTLIQMYIFFIFLFKKCWVFVVFSFLGFSDKLIYLDFSNWIFGLADINLKYLHYHNVYSIKLITTYI